MTAATRTFSLSDFDFALPPELIAQHPAPERSASRLLDGRAATPVDRVFRELPGLLRAGDLVVFNNTQVVKARLFGEKSTGGKVELLIERVLGGNQVAAHMRVSKKPLLGGKMYMAGGARNGGFDAVLLGRWPDANGPLFHLKLSDEPHALMEKHGVMPLPPYIERPTGPSAHSDTATSIRPAMRVPHSARQRRTRPLSQRHAYGADHSHSPPPTANATMLPAPATAPPLRAATSTAENRPRPKLSVDVAAPRSLILTLFCTTSVTTGAIGPKPRPIAISTSWNSICEMLSTRHASHAMAMTQTRLAMMG